MSAFVQRPTTDVNEGVTHSRCLEQQPEASGTAERNLHIISTIQTLEELPRPQWTQTIQIQSQFYVIRLNWFFFFIYRDVPAMRGVAAAGTWLRRSTAKYANFSRMWRDSAAALLRATPNGSSPLLPIPVQTWNGGSQRRGFHIRPLQTEARRVCENADGVSDVLNTMRIYHATCC